MGRVTINGTQSQFSCKKSIPLDLWDVKGRSIFVRFAQQRTVPRAEARRHCRLILLAKNSYHGFDSEFETLLSAFDKDIANQKKRVGKDRVVSTLWAMERSRKDVAEFIQSHYRRTDMSMLELTPEFIKSTKFLG